MANLPDIGVGALPNDPDKKIEAIVKQVNEQNRLISNEDRTKIIKDDAGDARVLLGYQLDGFDNGDVGLKVSQQGNDVQSASDDNLIFSTDFNLFKIVEKRSTVIPSYAHANSTIDSQSITIPHGMNFTPIVKVFVEGNIVNSSLAIISSSFVPLPIFLNTSITSGTPVANYFFPTGGGNYSALGAVYAVDNTNIYITIAAAADLGTRTFEEIPVTYYILRETAS